MFPSLGILEMALLAALLAPTDAALGKPVVTNPAVPAVMREALNLESGLNDGICVPIVVLLLGLAVGTQIEGGKIVHVGRVVVEAIGIGAVIGLALTWLTTRMLRFAERHGWISEHWVEIPIVALAAACFAAAQAAGGSGFIACFVGGLLLSGLRERHKEELLRGAEHMGEALALLTWVVFGAIVVARMIDRVTWPALLYAVLSLTVVRMVPVFLCLIGTRTSTADKLFIGWFGPRGLATIVFAVLVLDAKLPGNDTIMLAAGWTVLLSVIAHGVTANPLVKAIGARPEVDLFPDKKEADVAPNPPVHPRASGQLSWPCVGDLQLLFWGFRLLHAPASARERCRTTGSTMRPRSAIPGRRRPSSTSSSSVTRICRSFSKSPR